MKRKFIDCYLLNHSIEKVRDVHVIRYLIEKEKILTIILMGMIYEI